MLIDDFSPEAKRQLKQWQESEAVESNCLPSVVELDPVTYRDLRKAIIEYNAAWFEGD